MIEIEKMVETLKLLSDKTRLTILLLLEEKELCVCELVEILQTSQPNVSQHIRKLKDGGLVKEAKKGQWVYYSLAIDDKPFLTDLFKHLPSQKEKVEKLVFEESNCCD
ncbi:ArsR/SmtB family transcription factor [Paenibacillus sp. Soil787]|uniref:ArsR/SmtB family transcription factor n=1 Tax=Paenibacillus sp. Soil787 TaxID=1736411 RepID=UPI0007027009|nr:metalloregulator ArsR/SmtB family transcription factor [Paenibacillus sp. Soil787]KRF18619.1 ArsR family transcriptional regulator [Paenibacillus sp. Soil787]